MAFDECLRKFMFGNCVGEKLRNTFRQEVFFKNRPDGRSLVRLFNEHVCNQSSHVLAVRFGNIRVSASKDLKNKSFHGV